MLSFHDSIFHFWKINLTTYKFYLSEIQIVLVKLNLKFKFIIDENRAHLTECCRENDYYTLLIENNMKLQEAPMVDNEFIIWKISN